MKFTRVILVALLLLSLPALACDLVTGRGEPVATATPFPSDTPTALAPTALPTAAVPPTPQEPPTPEMTINFTRHESEEEGVRVEYPESWFIDESFFLIISDEEISLSDGDSVTNNSVVIIFGGPAAELPSTDPEALVMELAADYDLADDAEVIEGPTRRTIQGQDAATVVMRGTSDEQIRFVALMTVIVSDDWGGVIIATTPEDRLATDRPILEAIINSVQLFRPEVVEQPQEEGFITLGETVFGSVTEDGPALWRFSGMADEVVHLIVMPDDDFDVVVDIQDERGSTVLPQGPVDDSFGVERIENFRLPYSGEYTIALRGFAGATGSYEMTLTVGGVIGLDLPGSSMIVTDTLTQDGRHIFPFYSSEGSVLEVEAVPEGNLDIVLEVYRDLPGADNDELLETIDRSFGTETLTFTVPEDGRYYLVVLGYEGQAGSYEITLMAEPDFIFDITYDDLVLGYIGDEGYLEYTFTGQTNDSLTIVVESDTDLDAVIEFLDLEGNLLAEMDNAFAGEKEELTVTLPEDGRYTIRVRSFGGSPGGFALLIE